MQHANVKIQVSMMLLVSCSSLLLGLSIGDLVLVVSAIFGALSAFVLVDRMQWIELSGWFANLVSIAVLFFTMRGFLGAGSAGKLIAVAYLLTFLLTVLMFQKKTPRLCWQLMVLSVLQTSLAAIFNLNFEHGYLFIVYFVLAMGAMLQQNDFYQSSVIAWTNRRNSVQAKKHLLNSPALIESILPRGQNLLKRSTVIVPWLVGCLVFSFILFHSLPRSRQQDESAMNQNFIATGKSWETDLDVSGQINLSNRLVFRARYFDNVSGEKMLINDQTYFRGLALSRLIMRDGKTNWQAPYDHVFNELSYSKLDRLNLSNRLPLNGAKRVGIDIIAEPSNDPLLYAPMPAIPKRENTLKLEFDRDLSAITRKRARKSNQLTSFRYRLGTIVDSANRTLKAWPYINYINNVNDMPELPMEPGSPEHEMLTQLNPAHYPQLVQTAQRVARQYEDRNRIEICRALVRELSQSNGFSYTLDYRTVDKDSSLDPVEDFFANHRSGHCAMYASALALMLRSLDIPARYVVGYHGGSYNQLTDCYVIHDRNAHAWVEAYISPEQCTEEMFEKGMAWEAGSWLTLDATPPVNFENGNEAFDLARSIWQDYVISPDANKEAYNGPGPLQAGSAVSSRFSTAVDWGSEVIKTSKSTQFVLIALTVVFVAWMSLRDLLGSRRRTKKKKTKNPLRRFIGSALSLVAPAIGTRLRFGQPLGKQVRFYQQYEKILKKHLGIERRASQTHREFAAETNQRLMPMESDEFGSEQMSSLIEQVTTAFYQIRFGSIPLDNNTVADIENQLHKFDQALKKSVPRQRHPN